MSGAVVVDYAYRVKLLERLKTFQRESLLQAAEESYSFPAPNPGGPPQDDVSQALHEIALHLETLQDWDLCKTLYHRALEYPVYNLSIHADARFRLALCEERQGRYDAAIVAHQQSIAHEQGATTALMAHTRMRLARLLMDAERFPEALALLEQVAAMLPVDQMAGHEVLAEVGRCALRLGQTSKAIHVLQPLIRQLNGMEGEVEALRLLAEAYERSNQPQLAVDCYRRIVASGFSEPRTKAAATVRLQSLGLQ